MPLDAKSRRRPWPNHAKAARDKASEAAVEGIKELQPFVDGRPLDNAELTRRVSKAWGLFHKIARILEGVGAQTEP